MFGRKKGGAQPEMDVESAPAVTAPESTGETAKTEYPTLFVKIERYREILEELHALRTHIVNIKDLAESVTKIEMVLHEVSEVVQMTIASLQSVIDGASTSLATLDAEFIRPRGTEFSTPKGEVRPEITSSLKQLHSQLEKLKDDIRVISQ